MLLEPNQFIKNSLNGGCFLTWDAKPAIFLVEALKLLASICPDKREIFV